MDAAGIYYGRMTECGQAASSNGTPYLWIEFQIDHKSEDGQWVPCEVIRRDINFYLSEKAWPVSMAQLRGLGFNGNLDAPQFGAEVKQGMSLECYHEEYNGKWSAKWRLPYEGRERKPLDRSAVRALQAKLANEFKQPPAGAPVAPPAPGTVPTPITAPVSGQTAEDDIPF